MKRSGLPVFFLLLVGLSRTHAQDTASSILTLRQCIETGIANNLKVRQSDLQQQADGIAWKQARLNLLPSLNGSINHGINEGRSIDPFTNGYINQRIDYASYGLNSEMVLFNGFSLMNTIKQNSLAYQASKMDWQQEKDNLTINIILAYLLVLSTEDLLVQAENRLELTRQQVERLEKLNREGAISPPLLSDLRGQQADDELSLINTRQNLDNAKLSLCQLMNIPYSASLRLEKIEPESFASVYPSSSEEVYKNALVNFSLVKAVDLRRESALKTVQVRRGQLYPTLSLGGSAQTNYSSAAMKEVYQNTTEVASNDYVMVNANKAPVIRIQDNYLSEKIGYGNQLRNNIFTSIGLNLRIPLFNSLQARNRVKLARISYKNTEIVAESTRIQLRQSIEQAYLNMEAAAKRYKTIQDQVSAFTISFQAAQVRFDAGVGTSIDYLTAKNNLERAGINLINARYDFALRTRILDFYQGKQSWQ